MKKLMMLVMMLLMTPASAADKAPVVEYELAVSGIDDTVVEFVPEMAPHMLCVVYDIEANPTMQCFPRKEAN
ncbi:hypothetical protein VPHD148_0023 [Vibrio phage D148]